MKTNKKAGIVKAGIAALVIGISGCSSLPIKSDNLRTIDDVVEFGLRKKGKFIDAKEYVEHIADNSEVVLFGEDHNAVNEREFFSSMLPMFKDKGYHTLGLEIVDDVQKDMNKFLEDKITFKQLIEKNPNVSWMNCFDYINIVETAKKNGFDIICMDKERRRRECDYDMVENLLKGKEKMVVLVGNGHINHSTYTSGGYPAIGIAGHLRKRGIDVASISMERYFADGPIYEMYGKDIKNIVAMPKKILKNMKTDFPFEDRTYAELYDGVLLFPKRKIKYDGCNIKINDKPGPELDEFNDIPGVFDEKYVPKK